MMGMERRMEEEIWKAHVEIGYNYDMGHVI